MAVAGISRAERQFGRRRSTLWLTQSRGIMSSLSVGATLRGAWCCLHRVCRFLNASAAGSTRFWLRGGMVSYRTSRNALRK